MVYASIKHKKSWNFTNIGLGNSEKVREFVVTLYIQKILNGMHGHQERYMTLPLS